MFNLDFNVSFKVSANSPTKEDKGLSRSQGQMRRVQDISLDRDNAIDVKVVEHQNSVNSLSSLSQLFSQDRSKIFELGLMVLCSGLIVVQLVPNLNKQAETVWQQFFKGQPTADQPDQPEQPKQTSEIKPEWKASYRKGDTVDGTSFLLTSNFGNRRHPVSGRTQFHSGDDFGAPDGTPLYAPGKKGQKVQVKCWWDGNGGGNVATITNIGFSNVSAIKYLHMKKPCTADSYTVGQKIGEVGNTGVGTGPHLHLTQENDGQKVDPYKYFAYQALTGKHPY
jgi:murein DD-endopeptidase MepM/ murein hydrolase activator NlpD